MELSNDEMWMKYTCTHLPNKVPTCPLLTWFNSPESEIIHHGLDLGSHELENMGSHQNISLTKQHKHKRSNFSSASALR